MDDYKQEVPLQGAPPPPVVPARRPRRSKGANIEVTEQSRFKGVYYVLGGRWESKITFQSKTRHIGTFDTELEAAFAFDAKAHQLGVPHRANFIYDADGNVVSTQVVESLRGMKRGRHNAKVKPQVVVAGDDGEVPPGGPQMPGAAASAAASSSSSLSQHGNVVVARGGGPSSSSSSHHVGGNGGGGGSPQETPQPPRVLPANVMLQQEHHPQAAYGHHQYQAQGPRRTQPQMVSMHPQHGAVEYHHAVPQYAYHHAVPPQRYQPAHPGWVQQHRGGYYDDGAGGQWEYPDYPAAPVVMMVQPPQQPTTKRRRRSPTAVVPVDAYPPQQQRAAVSAKWGGAVPAVLWDGGVDDPRGGGPRVVQRQVQGGDQHQRGGPQYAAGPGWRGHVVPPPYYAAAAEDPRGGQGGPQWVTTAGGNHLARGHPQEDDPYAVGPYHHQPGPRYETRRPARVFPRDHAESPAERTVETLDDADAAALTTTQGASLKPRTSQMLKTKAAPPVVERDLGSGSPPPGPPQQKEDRRSASPSPRRRPVSSHPAEDDDEEDDDDHHHHHQQQRGGALEEDYDDDDDDDVVIDATEEPAYAANATRVHYSGPEFYDAYRQTPAPAQSPTSKSAKKLNSAIGHVSDLLAAASNALSTASNKKTLERPASCEEDDDDDTDGPGRTDNNEANKRH